MLDNAKQFGETVKKLRKARNLTIHLLADMSSIDKGHLSRIERGLRNPPKPDAILRLADALGVQSDYLMAKAGYISPPGEGGLSDEEILRQVTISPIETKAISKEYLSQLGEKFPELKDFIEFVAGRARTGQFIGELRRIPILGFIAAGGPEGYHSVSWDEYVMLPTAQLPADPDLFAVRVKGESMVGSDIKENDVVVISPAQKGLLKAGDIAAVRVGEEGITLKEVHNYSDGLILRSTNPDFPDLRFDEADIVGRAIRLVKVQFL
jgi:SOS-response transcriptional repressor LexA